MIEIRRSADRGHFHHGWLDTYHTFSFADYYDPRFLGFGALRVINEDRIEPGQGFGEHGHRDMEILTCVLEGELEHADSLGNGSVLVPGELQRMTAGRGIRHSEFNPSRTNPVHLYQIWLKPDVRGLAPSWEQKRFDPTDRLGRLRVVASADGRDASLRIHQDATVYLASIEAGRAIDHAIDAGRRAWLQVLAGQVEVGGDVLAAGDGAAFRQESDVRVQASEPAEILLFDLA